jgi:hypothetical protein
MEKKGNYSIVYYEPRFPYILKYTLDNIKDNILESKETFENIKNDDKQEASKIFFTVDDYLLERDSYIKLLNYNLPEIFFNAPLNFGVVNAESINNLTINNYKYKFKKIIKNCGFQITFLKGELICSNNKLNIIDFYTKLNNLIKCIQYLNHNNLLFDDLKINNVLLVNNLYKLSDYSSLIKTEELNIKYFNSSFLYTTSYFIYLPILNEVLKYYLNNRINNELFTNIEDSDKYYKNYINQIINNIKNIQLYKNINIVFTDKEKNENINIEFNKILNEMYDYRNNLNINKNIIINKNKNYYYGLIKYLDNKYGEDNEKIIKDLSKRINLFSLGILLIDIYNIKKDLIFRHYDFHKKIFIIISHLCLNFIIIDDILYIFEPDIDEIIDLYYRL